MAAVSSASSAQTATVPPLPSVKLLLDSLQFQHVEAVYKRGQKPGDIKVLAGTKIACSECSQEAGSWKNRTAFIERVVADLAQHCPKSEPLALVSLGSCNLLMEYIIGKALIEEGFEEVSFLLIDPQYRFAEGEKKDRTQQTLVDFREKIEAAYREKYQRALPHEKIKFLSRAQNIAPYFPKQANVVGIECLPMHAPHVSALKMHHLDIKIEDLLGGRVVPSADYANTLVFLPASTFFDNQIRYGYTKEELKENLPIAFDYVKSETVPRPFCLNWGCKLFPDGSYRSVFSGWKKYSALKNLSSEMSSHLPTAVEQTLREQIGLEQKKSGQKTLTQANQAAVLEKVKAVVERAGLDLLLFFTTDYLSDKAGLIAFLTENSGHNYRKWHTLSPEYEDEGFIRSTEI